MKQLEQSLKELRRITGLPLDLTITDDMDAEKMQLQLSALCNTYREATSREVLLRRYLTSAIQTEDFLAYASRMHMHTDARYDVFLIQIQKEMVEEAITMLKSIFSDTSCIVFAIHQDQILIIREHTCKRVRACKDTAFEFLNILNSELLVHANIAYGSTSEGLTALPEIYHEAELAMKIGSIFYPNRNIYGYTELGIGTLIYDLPESACIKYIKHNLGEHFLKKESIFFEDEILETADCFLRCNLNIAETARQLHVHRNTLLYRLEQIQNETNLDIRKFSSAMTFKLCSLILHYLKELK